MVIRRSRVSSINLCIQSADHSVTGQRLAEYVDAYWWDREIRRFTGVGWSGTIKVGRCDTYPPAGWVNVREGRNDEVASGRIAHAVSWRDVDHTGILGRWVKSEIVIDRDCAEDDVYLCPESTFEKMLAHELGHVLGLFHTPPGEGFVMTAGEFGTWPLTEQLISQTAFEVGPSVMYPGVVRPTSVPALPLVGILLLAAVLAVVRLVRGR